MGRCGRLLHFNNRHLQRRNVIALFQVPKFTRAGTSLHQRQQMVAETRFVIRASNIENCFLYNNVQFLMEYVPRRNL